MLVSQGEFDYATKYIEIIRMFAEPKSISTGYLKELTNRLALFNEQLNLEVQKGIVEHDKGEYEKAISVYNGILKNYPNSAWTNYELYYSQHALNLKNEKGTLNDREDWDKSKLIIYKNNPMYYQDVRASNGKEGYLLFRRQSMSELFKSNDDRLSDVYKYADIAMDLGVYDFASQLFWFSLTFDKKNENSLSKFLYCIEKLGIMNLKENFKGDYKKEFKKIEKEKEKEMKESKIYKSFKN